MKNFEFLGELLSIHQNLDLEIKYLSVYGLWVIEVESNEEKGIGLLEQTLKLINGQK